MKKIFLVISLLLVVNLVRAQDSSKAECLKTDCSSENLNLPDSVKFQKALKDAAVIEPQERTYLQPLEMNAATIIVAALKGFSEAKDCNFSDKEISKFREKGIWVFLPNELKSVYKTKNLEFSNKENRLKQLIGLHPDYSYKCFVEFAITPKQLVRPSLTLEPTTKEGSYFFSYWGGNFPFTGLGYTCDWYYGDGCRYGLTEFNISPNSTTLKSDCPKCKEDKEDALKIDYPKFLGACTIDEYLGEKCGADKPKNQ